MLDYISLSGKDDEEELGGAIGYAKSKYQIHFYGIYKEIDGLTI